MDKALTVKQAAEHFGGGVMRVYRRIWSGELEAINVALPGAAKPSFMVAESAIQRYFANRTMSVPGRLST